MSEEEISMARFDECIRKINEHTARLKMLDAKLAAYKKQLKEAGMVDLRLLPVTW